MTLKRSQKVAGLLKAEISEVIQKRINDPLIGFITITEVVLSNDFRAAKVYFSVLGNETQKTKSLMGLRRARAFIQNEVGGRVRLRYMPVLRFYLDESWDYGEHIDKMLDNL